jgi:hypothetical protein
MRSRAGSPARRRGSFERQFSICQRDLTYALNTIGTAIAQAAR